MGSKRVSPRAAASSVTASRVLPSVGTTAFIEPETSISTSIRPLRVAVAHRWSAASESADSANGTGAARLRTMRPSAEAVGGRLAVGGAEPARRERRLPVRLLQRDEQPGRRVPLGRVRGG